MPLRHYLQRFRNYIGGVNMNMREESPYLRGYRAGYAIAPAVVPYAKRLYKNTAHYIAKPYVVYKTGKLLYNALTDDGKKIQRGHIGQSYINLKKQRRRRFKKRY